MITASSVIISEGVGGGGGGGGDTAWSSLTSAVSSLTLANGTNATTFNQTSAVTWEWANTTAATSGAAQSSPIMELAGQYWTGSVSATDDWTMQNVIGTGTNGTSILTFAHTGSSGTASIQLGSALNVTNGGTVGTSAGGSYGWGGRSRMFSPVDGDITLTPAAGSGNAFTRLQIGGTTASFPAIQVSGAGLVAELADGSAQTTFGATIFNAGTGFQVAGAATSANVLRGNGTNFVSAALAAADLSNGVTGSGAVVLAASPALTGTPTTPTATVGTNTTQVATTAFVLANAGGVAGLGNFNAIKWQQNFWSTANGSNTTPQDWGGLTTLATPSGGSGANAASSTTPPSIGFSAGASNTCSVSTNAIMAYGHNLQWAFMFNINRTTNNTGAVNRFWAGVTDQTPATLGGADLPVGNFAAFRFSNGTGGAGDTHWQCVTNNSDSSGASATVTDSGVTPDTNYHVFAIVCDDTVPNAKFYIDGVLVATNIATLPTAGKVMLSAGTCNQTSVAANAGLEYASAYMTSAQF